MPPADDLTPLWADWSQPITLQQITSLYDPDTATPAEQTASTTLPAVVGPITAHPDATPHQPRAASRTFLVRTADLPTLAPGQTLRIPLPDGTWQITTTDTPAPNLTQLTTHRLAP